ncbi:hypothetical protein KI688_002310 [Linnemannia hyalina]|uniref:Uncharacterized protein n=1 Tax=Linnemannia hyalina TaxID=64524 RepID=A0A9P8BRG5_9FUNG|nr:hypothetical protein KI688_002310 [Linnemannia hyalina]
MAHELLASCLLVSRYFHQALEPIFFSHLYLVYDKTRRPSPALIQSQYLHRIRHLFTINFISVDYLLLDFRNLTSISLKGFVYRGSYDYDEDDEVSDPDQVGSADEIMSVEFADIIGLSVLAQLEFLARCPNVQKIHWQSTTRRSQYVKHYRLLEQDNVISVNQPLPSTDDIRRFIQPGTWMHLRSLVVSGVYSPYYGKALEFIQDEGFAHILESIPTQHLMELDCSGTAFEPLGLEALKRHCDVLRLLVIKRSSSFTSALVQEALESFPKLTSLPVDHLSVEDVERGRPWACLNLRVLIAQFDMSGAVDVEDDQRRHRLLFDRISTLAGLERLTITGRCCHGSKASIPHLS